MESLGLDVLLYKRFVDDVNFIVREMRAIINREAYKNLELF